MRTPKNRVALLSLIVIVFIFGGCYSPMLQTSTTEQSTQWTYSIAWPWSMGIEYFRGERVTIPPFNERHIYESSRDGNIDHRPNIEPEWWKSLLE